MTDVIVTQDLTKQFGNQNVVENLSLHVERGEIYGFLGLNGAGKTTTIRMLLGILRPTTGSIQILGTSVTASTVSLWSRVGYLVETSHSYPELTVRENLEAMWRLRRLTDRTAVNRVIEQMDLTNDADRHAGTLSLGNVQRLGLAKAMLHEPELLILDEPANGLDPAGVVEIRQMLLSLSREKGVTVFMSSHILSEVARLVSRIGIIHEGRLIEELDAEAFSRRRRRWLIVDARDRAAARLALSTAGYAVEMCQDGRLLLAGERAIAWPDNVVRILMAEDLPPTRLAVEEEDLETYFLRLVGLESRSDR